MPLKRTSAKARTKYKKTLFEYLQEYKQGSEIQVVGKGLDKEAPDKLVIRFRGPVAGIPCFKNRGRGARRHMPNDVLARLQVMEQLLEQAIKGRKIYYSDTPLFLYVRFAVKGTKRGGNFDPDNALTTIKDWLEPRFKNHKDRGWGIGLTDNDRHIKAFAERQDMGSSEANVTELILCPLNRIDSILGRLRTEIREM